MKGSHLPIGKHDGDENRPRCDGSLDILRSNPPETINGKVGNLKPLLLQGFTGLQNRLMFGQTGNDMVPLLAE